MGTLRIRRPAKSCEQAEPSLAAGLIDLCAAMGVVLSLHASGALYSSIQSAPDLMEINESNGA